MESSKEQYEKPFECEEELNQKIARQSELNNMLDLENGRAMDEDLGGLKEEVVLQDIHQNDIGKATIGREPKKAAGVAL